MTIKALSTETAFYAQQLAKHLLLSTSGTNEDRIESMRWVFYVWSGLCRRMSELEALAPNSSELGREADEVMMERLEAFRERMSIDR